MELRQKLADMGYFGIIIPEKYGGLGLGAFEYCLICEELARGWMSVASIIARAQGGWIKSSMPEEMRAKFLPRMVRGEFLDACALSEPDTRLGPGGDLLPRGARRRRVGAHRQQVLVHLRRRRRLHRRCSRAPPTPPSGDKRWHGISCFLIEKPRGTLPEGHGRQPDSEDRLLRLEDVRAGASTAARAQAEPDRRATARRSC